VRAAESAAASGKEAFDMELGLDSVNTVY